MGLWSGCGSVDSAGVSDIRGPLFEYSHRQEQGLVLTIEKTKIKKMGPGMAQFKTINEILFRCSGQKGRASAYGSI